MRKSPCRPEGPSPSAFPAREGLRQEHDAKQQRDSQNHRARGDDSRIPVGAEQREHALLAEQSL